MTKAYVDTTVLTDALIKSGPERVAARAAIARYSVSQLPEYAIKEFKAGPLSYYTWMHNKLATTGSFAAALQYLQSMSRSPKRYLTSTAIQALQTSAAGSMAQFTTSQMAQKHGPNAAMDKVLCDEYRLAIKAIILLGWKERRKLTTEVVDPLSCYDETDPFVKRDLIELGRRSCPLSTQCSLAPDLRAKPADLKKLRNVALAQGNRPEHQRRAKALRELYRNPKRPVNEKTCRSLGDAIFAFFAPKDAVILTTNVTDHGPLAAALGKSVDKP